jgi:hypothetical protein
MRGDGEVAEGARHSTMSEGDAVEWIRDRALTRSPGALAGPAWRLGLAPL